MDIVEKLRAGTDDELLAHDLMFDAADEIERLRAVAIEKRAEADAAFGYSVEMRHENDLLREALRQYACDCETKCHHGMPADMCGWPARAALGEEKPFEDRWDNA